LTHERFEQLLDELDGESLTTLKSKNRMYSAPNDALHNFASGADIGGCTEAQACWGYLVKHLVALRDKIENNDFSNKDDLKEKCQDSINYIRFIWAIAHEGEDTSFDYDFSDDVDDCPECKYGNVEFEDDGITWKEPCKSCKNGIPTGSPKYETAKLKWKPKENKSL
jgi:hypothetical protein